MSAASRTREPYPVDPSLEFPDDHARFRHYRRLSPVIRTQLGPWVGLHWRHGALLTNPETTRQLEMETMAMQGIVDGPIHEMFSAGMLFANGEAHRRRRGPVVRTFAFKLMEAMRPEVRRLAEHMIRTRIGVGPIDFLKDIAGEIPARIIAGVLGVPPEDAAQFRDRVYSAIRGLPIHDPDLRPEIERDLGWLLEYVSDLFADRRRAPREDFLTRYLADTEGAGGMTPAEVRTQVAGLILAGADTTRLAISSTLSQLLQHKDQWAAFVADPDGLKKNVAEEGLRFDPAVASVPRVALAEIDLDGIVVPPGVIIAWSIMSAMRDEDVYADPDRFDIFRTDHPKWNPAFGAGAHRCLGEALARAELEETLAAIASLAPATALAGAPPTIAGVAAVRQIDKMAVAFA